MFIIQRMKMEADDKRGDKTSLLINKPQREIYCNKRGVKYGVNIKRLFHFTGAKRL